MLPNLGVCTQAAFGNRVPLRPHHIRELVATGVDWIEVGGPNDMCFDYEDDAFVDALVEAIAACDAPVWSMHGPFCPIALDDADAREKGIALLIRGGHIAARFGAGRMVMHPGRDVHTVDLAREIAWVREAIARALDAIPETVTLAVETVSRPWLGTRCSDLMEIVEGFDPKRVGICLDTGHWNMAGHLLESARIAVGHIVTVHIHDSAGEKNDHQMPGNGTIDWPQLIGTLRAGGYAGPLMLEAGPKGRPLTDHVAEYSRRMTEFTAAPPA